MTTRKANASKHADMHNIEEASKIVNKALDSYKADFMKLVQEYASSCESQGEQYCDFMVDIGSMMNGTWHITAICDFKGVPEFKEFDWYELLNIDEENMPEDDMLGLLNNSYKLDYIWLIEQLTLSKKQIKYVEVRLYHNGSNEYQPLA